jgi:hypothetical protein
MTRPSQIGLALCLLCGVAFVTSGWFMARRVRDYYDAVPPPSHLFVNVSARTFEAFGKPVRLTDAQTDGDTPALRVEFADRSLLLPVHPPTAPLPDLEGYNEWLEVLAFAPMTDGRVKLDEAALLRGEPGARLVIVKRNAAPGFEDDPGGLVARTRWTFDFVELTPAGDITTRRMQFRNRRGELPALKDDPAAAVAPIEERSWEWQAALFTIPKLHISSYRYKTDAVDGSDQHPGMGWTLPVAGFSALGLTLSLALFASGYVRPCHAPRA